MNSWSIDHRRLPGSERAGTLWGRLFPGAGSPITLSGAAFSSLETSPSATLFTTSMGTCSKCVRDFRVAPFVFLIDEQYLSGLDPIQWTVDVT
jgi:hypothetical protein